MKSPTPPKRILEPGAQTRIAHLIRANKQLQAELAEHQRAGAALREKEERLRFSLEAANVGTWEWNILTDEVCWSENMEKVHGQAPGSFSGTFEAFLQGVHPEDRETVLTTIKETIQSGGEYQIEYRQAAAGENVKWMEGKGRVIRNDASRPVRMIGICLDITERKRAQEVLQRRHAAKLKVANQEVRIGIAERERTEEALRESEQRLHAVLDSSPSIIFLKDPEGRYIYVNTQFQKLCDLTRDQIIGKTDGEIFPPAQADAFRANDLKALQAGAPVEFEEAALQEDGPHTSIVNKFPLRDTKGKVYAICGMVTDITARKRAEQALGATEERFRMVVEGVRDYAIFMLDPEGRVVSWNAGAERIKGYRAEEILGQHFSRFYPAEDIERGKPMHELEVAATEGRFEDEGWRMRKDGSRVWANVIVTSIRDDAGELKGFSKVIRDITARKQMEDTLRSSEEKFRAVTESASDAIISANSEGNITYFNQAAENIFGYSARDVLGEPLTLLMPERFHNAHQQGLAGFLSTGKARLIGKTAELVGKRKDSTEFPIEISLATWKSGEDINFTGILRDITGRKRVEEALRNSEESLRQLSARLIQSQEEERRRVARELHDSTSQMLVSLIAQLHMVKKRAIDLDDRTSQALVESLKLAKDAEREIRTVSYLLHPPILDEMGVASAIQWYADGFRQRSGIQIELDLAADLPRLSPDAEVAVFRIVQEGLTNIHLHSGSPVAKIRLTSNKKEVVLEIGDKGRGMPAEVLERPEAAGVGITGMHERMRQLGGRVKIRSNKRGTVVAVIVPRPQVEKSRLRPTAAAERAVGAGHKV